jgi:mannosyltransferase OCH1-like enzyme
MIKILLIAIILIIVGILYQRNININTENFKINNNNIPKVIYLTYKTKNIPEFIIPNWKKLNPGYKVKLYDNNDCIKFLKEEYGNTHVNIFNYIKDGPIKSDFWRCCILYKYGGVYGDVDMEPLVPISDMLENGINFYTCKSKYPSDFCNPTIIISIKGHPILKCCIDKYIYKYINNHRYSYWKWSIGKIMNECIKEYINQKIFRAGKYKDIILFKEKGISQKAGINYDNYIEYNSLKLFNNRYSEYDSYNHEFI